MPYFKISNLVSNIFFYVHFMFLSYFLTTQFDTG